jgi:hypothetical protein
MSSSNRSNRDQNSSVGYGRPPVNRQFKPGQSGNPKGRRKGRKNFTTMFVDILSRKIKVRDKNGLRTLSKLEAMIEIMTNKAIAGDPHAFAKIVQIAEKLEAFKWQAPDAYRSVESPLEDMMQRLETMRERMQKPGTITDVTPNDASKK